MQTFTKPARKATNVRFEGGSSGLLYGARIQAPRPLSWAEDDHRDDERFHLERVSDQGWLMRLRLPHDQALDLIEALTNYAHSYRAPSAMHSKAGGWYGSQSAEDLLHGWYVELDDTRPWRNVEMARAMQRLYPDGWEVELFGEGSRLAAADGSERADAPFDDLWQCAYALQIAYTNSGLTESIYKPLLEDLLHPFAAPRYRATSSFTGETWKLGLTDAEVVLSAMSATGGPLDLPHFRDTAHFAQTEIFRQVGSNHHELRAWLRARITAIGGRVDFRIDEKRLEVLDMLARPGIARAIDTDALLVFRERAGLAL